MTDTVQSPSAPAPNAAARPLDSIGIALVLMLCLSWGFNQVAVKFALHDIPPLMQAAIRSFGAALIVAAVSKLRGVPLFSRDGTLIPGAIAGVLFAGEFTLVYQGLAYTTATRATLFLYLTPFFVVLGSRIVLPVDRFTPHQWIGLCLSFVGMIIAFGLPTPSLDPRQMLGDVMTVIAAALWAATTLLIKTSPLKDASAEKVMLYQLIVSAPVIAILAAMAGEQVTHWPGPLALGSMLYQTIWVVSITYVIWFALIARYSVNRLSAFTFLTPLFGVAAGHLVLGEPLTVPFLLAVALVIGGLVVVNRAK
jgi:drug/metabolite transporter (DMT)-like permease